MINVTSMNAERVFIAAWHAKLPSQHYQLSSNKLSVHVFCLSKEDPIRILLSRLGISSCII